MAIKRIEVKDFLVFKGEFAADFCHGVNVLIGGNGTGKTTIMRCLYELKGLSTHTGGVFFEPSPMSDLSNYKDVAFQRNWGNAFTEGPINNYVYVPEKDILEHAKGLLSFIKQKQTGFSAIYEDVLITAQDVPTQEQTEIQKSVGQKIASIIGGIVHWEQGDGMFYTIRTDGIRIPFAYEASGFKKLGYLGLLIASGQLESGSVLFWDEPENSLNPELIPELVNILLELSRNSVQIFIATHSELLASYFAVSRKKGDHMKFISLYTDNDSGKIKSDMDDRFDLLEPNSLTAEPVKLYELQIVKGLNGNA